MNNMSSRFKLISIFLICLLLAISYSLIKSPGIKKPAEQVKLFKNTSKKENKKKSKSINKVISKKSVDMTLKPTRNQLHTLVPKVMVVSGTLHDNLLAKNIITGSKLIASSPIPSSTPTDKKTDNVVMSEEEQLSVSNDNSYMTNTKVYKSSQLDENIDDLKTGLDSTIEDDILNKDDLIYSMFKKSKSVSHASKLYSGLKEPLVLPWFILLGLLFVLVVLLKFVGKSKL